MSDSDERVDGSVATEGRSRGRDGEGAPQRAEEDHANEQKEQGGGGEKKEGKKPKRPSKKTLIIGGIVLGVLLLLGLLYYLHARHFVSTDDAYTTGHVHPISARIAGTVSKVFVNDNQEVHAGQTLVQLDPSTSELNLEKARAQLGQARASLEQAEADVLQKKATSERAEADLQKAQTDFDRVNGLYQQDVKAVSKAEVDAADAALKSAKGGFAAARANTVAAEAQRAVAHAGVASVEAALHDAQLQLSYTTIEAPVDGVISKKTAETGQRIQPGQAVMAVVGKDIWVVANLKETQLAQVRVGQTVSIHVDAVPDQDFAGRVDSFQAGTGAEFALLPPDNATGNFTKIVQRVPVKIVFDQDSLGKYRNRIVPGLSCAPTIDLRTR